MLVQKPFISSRNEAGNFQFGSFPGLTIYGLILCQEAEQQATALSLDVYLLDSSDPRERTLDTVL
jgi:hypothetical protein